MYLIVGGNQKDLALPRVVYLFQILKILYVLLFSVCNVTYPIDCGFSYLYYGAANVLVLCGSPLKVTWGLW